MLGRCTADLRPLKIVSKGSPNIFSVTTTWVVMKNKVAPWVEPALSQVRCIQPCSTCCGSLPGCSPGRCTCGGVQTARDVSATPRTSTIACATMTPPPFRLLSRLPPRRSWLPLCHWRQHLHLRARSELRAVQTHSAG